MMSGSDVEAEAEQKHRNIPKLQILSPPTMMKHSPERSGMITPPFYSSSASVPFGWEEEPGKPMPCTSLVSFTNQKCLELPPRLMLLHDDDDSTKLNKLRSKLHSPNTVLEGPYVCSNSHLSTSFRILNKGVGIKEKIWFGSWRRKKDFKVRSEVSGGSDVFSYSYADSCTNADHVGVTEVRHKNVSITKMKRSGSFYNMFHSKLWTTISGGLKHVVPRRSKSLKKMDISSLHMY